MAHLGSRKYSTMGLRRFLMERIPCEPEPSGTCLEQTQSQAVLALQGQPGRPCWCQALPFLYRPWPSSKSCVTRAVTCVTGEPLTAGVSFSKGSGERMGPLIHPGIGSHLCFAQTYIFEPFWMLGSREEIQLCASCKERCLTIWISKFSTCLPWVEGLWGALASGYLCEFCCICFLTLS